MFPPEEESVYLSGSVSPSEFPPEFPPPLLFPPPEISSPPVDPEEHPIINSIDNNKNLDFFSL